MLGGLGDWLMVVEESSNPAVGRVVLTAKGDELNATEVLKVEASVVALGSMCLAATNHPS
jgi:hypothetical protein